MAECCRQILQSHYDGHEGHLHTTKSVKSKGRPREASEEKHDSVGNLCYILTKNLATVYPPSEDLTEAGFKSIFKTNRFGGGNFRYHGIQVTQQLSFSALSQIDSENPEHKGNRKMSKMCSSSERGTSRQLTLLQRDVVNVAESRNKAAVGKATVTCQETSRIKEKDITMQRQ